MKGHLLLQCLCATCWGFCLYSLPSTQVSVEDGKAPVKGENGSDAECSLLLKV